MNKIPRYSLINARNNLKTMALPGSVFIVVLSSVVAVGHLRVARPPGQHAEEPLAVAAARTATMTSAVSLVPAKKVGMPQREERPQEPVSSAPGVSTGVAIDHQPASSTTTRDDPLDELEMAISSRDWSEIELANVHLASQLQRTPGLGAAVFGRYLQAPDSKLGSLLLQALAQSGDLRLELDALDVAVSGPTEEQQVAALALLSETPALPGYVRTQLRHVVADEFQSVHVRRQALQALRRRGPIEAGEVEPTTQVLMALADDADPTIREQSLDVLSEWSDSTDVRDALMYAAAHDPSPGVRVSDLAALSRQTNLSESDRRAVAGFATDPGEAQGIRVQAWRVLEQYPMQDALVAQHRSFLREQMRTGMALQEEILEDVSLYDGFLE